jgi:hypothetical protein
MTFTHEILLIDDEVVKSGGRVSKVVARFDSTNPFGKTALYHFRQYARKNDGKAEWVKSSNLARGYWRLSNGDCLELR